MDTSNNVRLYSNTITGLGFAKSGNGIKLEDFDENHFFLGFDLTSTEETSKSLTLFPEVTGSSLTLKLYFSKALDDAFELFLIGERFRQVLYTLPATFPKTHCLMDNLSLAKVATKCATTSLFFGGVWYANNYPKIQMPKERKSAGRKTTTVSVDVCNLLKFQIINSSPSNKISEHWLLPCVIDIGNGVGIFVWDCFGRALSHHDLYHSRLWMLYGKSGGFKTINLPLQKLHSNLCGLYCLYLVGYLVKKPFDVSKLQKNHLPMQTTELDVVRFFNEHVNGAQFKYRVF